MTNNDVLRRLRYMFGLSGGQATREQISAWLKKEDDPAYRECGDLQLAIFLNGLIIDKRGTRTGSHPEAEPRLTNNLIFKKLKIALNLKTEDILELMSLAGMSVSPHELSALFRKPGHKHYRVCKDQILRNFLKGVQLKFRTMPAEPEVD